MSWWQLQISTLFLIPFIGLAFKQSACCLYALAGLHSSRLGICKVWVWGTSCFLAIEVFFNRSKAKTESKSARYWRNEINLRGICVWKTSNSGFSQVAFLVPILFSVHCKTKPNKINCARLLKFWYLSCSICSWFS